MAKNSVSPYSSSPRFSRLLDKKQPVLRSIVIKTAAPACFHLFLFILYTSLTLAELILVIFHDFLLVSKSQPFKPRCNLFRAICSQSFFKFCIRCKVSEDVNAVIYGVAGTGAKWDNRFSAEIIRLQKRCNYNRSLIQTDRGIKLDNFLKVLVL